MPLVKWKSVIKEKIAVYEYAAHVFTNALYKKSELFIECVKPGMIWPWYVHSSRYPKFTKQSTLLMRLVLGLEFNSEDYKHFILCKCQPEFRTSASHVMFECPLLSETQRKLWKDVESKGPEPLIKYLNELSVKKQILFYIMWI